jgi:prephenate dehydrogenase
MGGEPGQESLALIGGYGKMGLWILEFLSENGLLDRLSVTITGPRAEVGRRVAERFGCSYSPDNLKAAESRLIVICTPLRMTPSIIEEVAPRLKKGTVLMDICSVKSGVCASAEKALGPEVEYLSVHPMFGPSVKNLEGQVVVIVPVRGGTFLPELKAVLAGHQARIIQATCEEHDYALGIVQCLTHFAFLSVGTTLKDLGFDIKRSRSFSSPVYELMLDMIGRILSGDPAMYAEIQISNPYSAEIEELFLQNAGRLRTIVDAGDAAAFSGVMVEAAKHYDDLGGAFSKSSRAVSALYEELVKLQASVGKTVAVRNEVTGAVHVGVLKEMTPDRVTIGDGKHAKRLKTSNVSLLAPAETGKHRVDKFGTIRRDVSFVFEESADPEVVSSLLRSYDDQLVSISPTDVFAGGEVPKGKKSVTFRLTFYGDLDAADAEKRVRELITSMGASER